jgi:Ca-activated chloride channel homolog
VLDRSSSMKLPTESDLPGLGGPMWLERGPVPPLAGSRWLALDRALRDFIDVLSKNKTEKRIGVVTFASTYTGFGVTSLESTTDCDMTNDMNRISATVDKLSSSLWNGNTFIESGMRQGIEMLSTSPMARKNAEKVMIVLTDGFQTDGDCRNAAYDCAGKHIRVNSITVGDFADKALMQEVAVIGNGSHAHASNEDMLREIFRQLAAESSMLVQ